MSKPTMKSIADELGVSRSTVSFVLAGEAQRHRIKPETAQRILRRAAELGFRPNYFARALNTKKTGAIGLLFPDVHENYMSQMVRGIDEVLAHHDAIMMLSSSRMDRQLEMRNIESMLYRGIDGLIIVPCADFNSRPTAVPTLGALLADSRIPVVCADRIPAGWRGNAVVQNDRTSAQQAVDRLIERGAKRVACISFDLAASSIAERIAGYRDALQARQQASDPRLLVRLDRVDARSSDLTDALRALLALPADERPDACFVTTEGLSYRTRELLQALASPLPIARFGADPPHHCSGMISVRQPHFDVGRRAAELLFAQIDDAQQAARCVVVANSLQD